MRDITYSSYLTVVFILPEKFVCVFILFLTVILVALILSYVDQAGLEVTEIPFILPSKC